MNGRDDWDAKAVWMREVAAIEATFAADGSLVNVKLEPCGGSNIERTQSETSQAPTETKTQPQTPRTVSRAGPRLVPRPSVEPPNSK